MPTANFAQSRVYKDVRTGELIEFAAEQQRHFDAATSLEERKDRGHFGTPPAIASFMAGMFSGIPAKTVRILDPGAGVGTLSAAVCQRVLSQSSPRTLFFELWENDPKLIPLLEGLLDRCQQELRTAGHEMKFVIKTDDFILANAQHTLFETGPKPSFHLAILNPPYFKLRKESSQAQAMSHVVHGQPNIYALFMALAADLLLPGGEMVAITPRSYFNGPYFKRFRKWFFDRMIARRVHTFESRTEAFKKDAVLQENVILQAQKGGSQNNIVLTSSTGRDFLNIGNNTAPYDSIVDNSNGDHVIRITASNLDKEIVSVVDALPARFRSSGFAISTGPVVTFRCSELLRRERADDTAPLLWMHNIRPFQTQFPAQNKKPTHIEVSEASKKLLVAAKWYVLLKRFTAKEEKRRLVAGIIKPADSYAKWIGIENHLNYVYRREADLTRADAFGLAAYFNSVLVDRYFRAISGNTQVNATEIRAMPLPNEETLLQIGTEVENLKVRDFASVETIVGNALGLPRRMVDQLVEVAK